MIECPKCHFVQPDDDFCANCGVNIKAYREKHQGSQRLKNLVPYLLTFCLVGALIGFFFLQFYLPKKAETKPSEVTAANSAGGKAAVAAASRAAPQQPPSRPMHAEKVEVKEEAPQQAAAVEGNKMAAFAAEDKKDDEKFSVEALEVYFVEVPKAALAQLSQDAVVLSDTAASTALWFAGDNKASILSKGQIVTNQNYRQANPSETTPLKILYQGGIRSADEILYQMQVMPKQIDDKRIRIHISGSMKWLVDEGEMKASTSSSFDSTYSVNGPGQLVLIGVLPQGKRPSLVTRDVLAQTPLGILNSENFHKKLSDLMLVISVH